MVRSTGNNSHLASLKASTKNLSISVVRANVSQSVLYYVVNQLDIGHRTLMFVKYDDTLTKYNTVPIFIYPHGYQHVNKILTSIFWTKTQNRIWSRDGNLRKSLENVVSDLMSHTGTFFKSPSKNSGEISIGASWIILNRRISMISFQTMD